MLKKLLALLILTLTILPAGTVFADEPVELTVNPVTGQVRMGASAVVEVILKNEGPDIFGEIHAFFYTRSPSPVLKVQDVALPRGSTKRYLFEFPARLNDYGPTTAEYKVSVKLVDSQNNVLASGQAEILPTRNIDVNIGVLSPGDPALSYFRAMDFGKVNGQPVGVNLTYPKSFPSTMGFLDNFDMLVLAGQIPNDPKFPSLLAAWVRRGGILFIGGGPRAEQVLAQIPESIRPGVFRETRTVSDLPLFEVTGQPVPFTAEAAVIDPSPESTVVIGTSELPAVVQREVGAGRIIYCALDPALEPFTSFFLGSAAFFEDILKTAVNFQRLSPLHERLSGQNLSAALRYIPELGLPDPLVVLVVLVIYILMIGPLNYIILKRIDHRDFAWLTIPLVVLLFTTGIYGAVRIGKGTATLVHNITVVRVSNEEYAWSETALGVFSQQTGDYELALPAGFKVESLGDISHSSSSMSTDGDPYAVIKKDSVVLKEVSLWSLEGFTAEGLIENPGRVTSDLSVKGETVVGTITSELPFDLEDTVAVIGRRSFPVGDLRAGEPLKVSFTLSSLAQPGGPYPAPPGVAYLAPRTPNSLEARRSAVYSYLFESREYGAPELTSKMVLIGWTEESLLGYEAGNGFRTHQLTAVVASLPVKMSYEGEYLIPPGLFFARVDDVEAENLVPQYSRYHLDLLDGTARLSFALPRDLPRERIGASSISFGQRGLSPADVYIQNQQTGDWDRLSITAGTAMIKDLDRYLTTDCRIYLKVESSAQGSNPEIPTIGIKSK